MTFRELDTVILNRDLPEHGLLRGDAGAIVHLHAADAFEVEFVRASGRTHALLTLSSSDVRAAGDLDVIAMRSLQ